MTMTANKNERYINGSWYEEQYTSPHGLYRATYIDNPNPEHMKFARDTNNIFCHLVAGYTNIEPGAAVLDLGSGIGMYMEAWEALGFDISGIEITEAARKIAPERFTDRTFISKHDTVGFRRLIKGSVADMSMFTDKRFDLVFSSAFFEHVDESILDKVLSECARVGRIQAHLIATEVGRDISHINIKHMEEWRRIFAKATGGFAVLVPDHLLNEFPVLVVYPSKADVPYPVAKMLLDNGLWNSRKAGE